MATVLRKYVTMKDDGVIVDFVEFVARNTYLKSLGKIQIEPILLDNVCLIRAETCHIRLNHALDVNPLPYQSINNFCVTVKQTSIIIH